ncbi:EAL domain-containing protein [Lysinibacillus fusiformis]|nr:EAL domain-containing protein [Lysinibacillus fusiformis]
MKDITKAKKKSKLKELFLKKEFIQNRNVILNRENSDRLLNYYLSLAQYHPDIVIVFSPEGEIVTIDDKKVQELLGEKIQKTDHFYKILPQKFYKEIESAFYNTLKGKSEKLEIEINTIKHKTLFLVLTFIPIKYEEEVDGIYLIVTNITEKVLLQQKLILSERHLNSAQQVTEIGSWEYIIEEDKLFCSENFYRIFGIEEDDFISMDDPFNLVHPHDYEDAFENLRYAINHGRSYTGQFRIVHGKQKNTRYIRVHAEYFSDENEIKKIIGVVKDETYLIQLENKLAEQNESYEQIFNNLTSGIWIRETIGGRFLFASKGLEKILDMPVSKLYEDSDLWYYMIHPNYYQELENSKVMLGKGESIQTIYQFISNIGQTKWLLEEVVPIIDENGQVKNIFGLVTDVTDEIEIKEKLSHISNFDILTGLPNQRSLYEKLDKLCGNNNPFAIFFLDIDRFNIINDSLGYSIGDEVLKYIAKRFKELIPRDGYLARLNSNNFIMIIKNYKSKNDVFSLAKKIIEEISESFTIQDYELHVSTSMGITFYPEEGNEKRVLLENAHKALYHAKKEGKNNYQLSSHLSDISSYKKYVLDRDMRKAITNEEFELYFQPQVEPRYGKISGAEALIRWNHKEWGMVSPGEFIPLAEENHTINNITDWVIQKVFSFIRDWIDRGFEVQPISINIPPIRFIKMGFLTFVEKQLEFHKIPSHYIEFEITEGSLLKSDKKVIETIKGIKRLGIKFAVDDFGTGYASLDSLRKFQPNTIKLDQIFIKHIGDENGIEKGIISSVMHLSKVLDMKVVAEGVEELEQLKFLKQNECDLIQGYIYSQPVKVKTFEKLLEQRYLKAEKSSRSKKYVDKRKFYRFQFPFPIPGELTIIEVNGNEVNVGKSPVLIENISLGGVRVLSPLKLPVNTQMIFSVKCQILNETFEFAGSIKWIEDETMSVFVYGVSFEKLNRILEDRLASIINRLSSYSKSKKKIPDTEFIYEGVNKYFDNNK